MFFRPATESQTLSKTRRCCSASQSDHPADSSWFPRHLLIWAHCPGVFLTLPLHYNEDAHSCRLLLIIGAALSLFLFDSFHHLCVFFAAFREYQKCHFLWLLLFFPGTQVSVCRCSQQMWKLSWMSLLYSITLAKQTFSQVKKRPIRTKTASPATVSVYICVFLAKNYP